MKHRRSARGRWLLATGAILGLSILAVLIVIRLERDDGPSDFGAPPPRRKRRWPAAPPPSRPHPPPMLHAARTCSLEFFRYPDCGSKRPSTRLVWRRTERPKFPSDARRVGWYRFGPAPGSSKGSAVIVGHVDSRTQGLGVLAKLDDVRADDRVDVRGSDGSSAEYRIVSRRTVPKDELADSGVFRRDGEPVLTLITCTGPFLKDRGGYQDNLVITAVPEAS